MPIQSKIKVSKFTYANGTVTWRVSGSVEGKQVRKNFKSRKDALDEKQRLEVDQINGETDGRAIWTTLSREDNRDAIAALSELRHAGSKKSLSFAVHFMLKHYRESGEEMSIDKGVEAYLEHKSLEDTRGIISTRQYKSIKYEMRGLKKHFKGQLLDSVTGSDIERYLHTPRRGNNSKDNGFSMKTWNNRRGLLSTFFKFCYEKKWVGKNPIEDVQMFKVKHRRSTAETLTTEQAADLMAFLETYTGPDYKKRPAEKHEPGFLVPYFALAMFAGIRPDLRYGEISKIRPKDIDFSVGVIRIEPEISKVNERRIIKLQPNLRAWLTKYPLRDIGAVPVGDPNRIILEVRKKFSLGHDVLRHTFISMMVAAFKSVGEAALQAGNSEAVVRRHYLDLKTEAEADAFWHIMPEGMKLPAKMEKKDGQYVAVATKKRRKSA